MSRSVFKHVHASFKTVTDLIAHDRWTGARLDEDSRFSHFVNDVLRHSAPALIRAEHACLPAVLDLVLANRRHRSGALDDEGAPTAVGKNVSLRDSTGPEEENTRLRIGVEGVVVDSRRRLLLDEDSGEACAVDSVVADRAAGAVAEVDAAEFRDDGAAGNEGVGASRAGDGDRCSRFGDDVALRNDDALTIGEKNDGLLVARARTDVSEVEVRDFDSGNIGADFDDAVR